MKCRRQYYPNGQLKSVTQLHRDNGPAEERFSTSGILIRQSWYKDNFCHREGAPADKKWDLQGNLLQESYYEHGQIHREDGPAIIAFEDEDLYYFEGLNLTYQTFRDKREEHIQETVRQMSEEWQLA